MLGRHAAAGCHIRSGAKLLQEIVYDPKSRLWQHEVLGCHEAYVPLDVLAKVFAGLDGSVATVS